MLQGLNLRNGYMSVDWNKSRSIVDIKIFNNNDDLVFTGRMTGYDFTKMLLSEKTPIEGTISFNIDVVTPCENRLLETEDKDIW